jgi:hexosaminidase
MFRILLSLTLLGDCCAATAATPPMMPMPAKVETANGRLAIDGGFSAAATRFSDDRLQAALKRLAARIARQTGIPIGLGKSADSARRVLSVECAAAGPAWPTLGEDEAYTLDIAADGARVKAATVAGALHGLETFAQLIAPGPEGFSAPVVHIEDKPRFPWRGLMIDVARHFMPVEVLERNLNAMAAVKLNVFHWHLSEDQGFRAESKRYPRLHELGSDGQYYTQDQIRHIVAFARDRGIRVIPEFDIPGHTQSWFPGYPELASAPGPYTIGRTWGIYDPVMDPSNEQTYQFLEGFIGEMAQLFPDPYFHIGGDEVNGRQWNQSQKLKAFAKEHHLEGPHDLQVYFNRRVSKVLQANGKVMVGWDEVLHPDLPTETVIQSWRGAKSLADAASKGHRGILSSGYYLDHLSPAALHYANDPLGGPAAALTPEQAANILGGEACMWAEYVNAETVDSRIWPRMAAIAERLWSPKEITDVDSMYARMEAVSRMLEWTGVQHRAGYAPMLERMTGGRPSEPLRVMADASEALGLSGRARAQKYTSMVPLNRFVDAVRPESESVRALEAAAARVVASPTSAAAENKLLSEGFRVWASNDERFQSLAEGNLLMAELKPLSKDLAALGAMGVKILDYLVSGKPAPADWIETQNKELTRMARPTVEVKLAATRPVKLLLDGLASKSK